MQKRPQKQQIFLVFNTSHLGDTLLCNSLCRNIKNLYPNSKIVFIVNKPFYEAALYQKDVDEVIAFDKFGEHKSLLSRIKFILKFPYKRADYAFVTYRNNTNSLIARLIMSKKIIEYTKKKIHVPMQEYFINLLKNITDETLYPVPIKFEVSKDLPEHLRQLLPSDKKYVALCTLTTDKIKDIPIDTAIDTINLLVSKGYVPVFMGTGNNAQIYAENLRQNNCTFVDLVNKTSVKEIGAVLQNCEALISADTGLVHVACGVGTPIVEIFNNPETIKQWAPDKNLYKISIIHENKTANNIIDKLEKLLEQNGNLPSCIM